MPQSGKDSNEGNNEQSTDDEPLTPKEIADADRAIEALFLKGLCGRPT